MREVLIINLTRMGDILQSTPIMRGLKRKFPGCSITYVVTSSFAEICKGIPYIDRLIVFDMDDYYRRLHSSDPVETYRILEGFIGEINKKDYDLLINLTPSRSCALLTSLINAKEICGLTIDGEGYRLLKGPWMRYFTTSVFNRHLNPFNLVDMHAKACGVGGDREGLALQIPSHYKRRALKILEEEGVGKEEVLIGFQPGASREHKRWGVENFGALAKRLCRELDVKVLVFGSKAERDLGKRIKEMAGEGVVDLTGRTDLMELAALIKRCRLLVTNDSGTMHIATAVGTRVIELSLGAAYFRETGPYGEGHIVIESRIPCHPCNFNVDCRGMACRDYIGPYQVFQVVRMVLEDRITPIEDGEGWDSVQIYRSVFDSMGLLEYVPLIQRPMGEREALLHAYRRMWVSLLDGKGPFEGLRDGLSHGDFIPTHIDTKDLTTPFKRLRSLAEEGIALSERLKALLETSQKEEMERVGERMVSIDDEIVKMRFLYPWISPIANFFSYSKESLEGDNIQTLIERTKSLYRFLRDQATAMEWLLEGLPHSV